jgi:uncharacterized protein YggE
VADRRTIEVFGSQTIRVAPDLAVVNFSINAKAIDPSQAVTQVKQKTEQILEALESYEIVNVDTSKALVNKKSQANDEVVYYSSSMNCEITTSDIDRITDIQLTIVEMGAENLSSTGFVSTELKRHRKQARMEAMQAAMEKASYYCAAANIKLGPPLQIVDQNPDFLEDAASTHRLARAIPHMGSAYAEELVEATNGEATINVSGAVKVIFEVDTVAFVAPGA